MQNFKEQKILVHNKVIHFIGIGGIGMSSIANLLYSLGFNVRGSDISVNTNIERLREIGIPVNIGHQKENIHNADIIVISSAIKPDNIEYQEAMSLKLPIYKRGRVLGEIMGFFYGIAVTGAHGKTTTTSLIGEMLYQAGLEPTVVVGGVVNDWQSNLKLGQGKFFVAEADESDGSFLNLPSIISVVTNIESEHLDYYKSVDNLQQHFVYFLNKVPFFGKAIACIDDPGVQEVVKLVKNTNISTYGFADNADYRAFDITLDEHGAQFSVFIKSKNQTIANIKSNLCGLHNILNALAAIAVIDSLDLDCRWALKALASFKGISRRFTNVGSYKGVQIFDDYAHHPSEIKAVLLSAKNIVKKGKIIVILQPHRYSRLKEYFKDFINVLQLSDKIFILPVYAAGELPNDYTSETLVQGLAEQGYTEATLVAKKENIPLLLRDYIKQGNVIIAMGAGDITQLAKSLQTVLEEQNI